jgi:hypothetical protein
MLADLGKLPDLAVNVNEVLADSHDQAFKPLLAALPHHAVNERDVSAGEHKLQSKILAHAVALRVGIWTVLGFGLPHEPI